MCMKRIVELTTKDHAVALSAPVTVPLILTVCAVLVLELDVADGPSPVTVVEA